MRKVRIQSLCGGVISYQKPNLAARRERHHKLWLWLDKSIFSVGEAPVSSSQTEMQIALWFWPVWLSHSCAWLHPGRSGPAPLPTLNTCNPELSVWILSAFGSRRHLRAWAQPDQWSLPWPRVRVTRGSFYKAQCPPWVKDFAFLGVGARQNFTV